MDFSPPAGPSALRQQPTAQKSIPRYSRGSLSGHQPAWAGRHDGMGPTHHHLPSHGGRWPGATAGNTYTHPPRACHALAMTARTRVVPARRWRPADQDDLCTITRSAASAGYRAESAGALRYERHGRTDDRRSRQGYTVQRISIRTRNIRYSACAVNRPAGWRKPRTRTA